MQTPLHTLLRELRERRTEMPLSMQKVVSGFWLTVVTLLALQAFTGLLMAFHYEPTVAIKRDELGRVLLRARLVPGLNVKVDRDGDTIARAGQTVVVSRDIHSGQVLWPQNDSAAFVLQDSVESGVSAAQFSTEFLLRERVPYGALLLQLHKSGASVLILCCYSFLVVLLLGRLYRYEMTLSWSRMVSAFTSVLLCAWMGSILPWDARSHEALLIGSSMIGDYLPLFGPWIRQLVQPTMQYASSLQSVFILHCFVVPLTIIALLKGFRYTEYKTFVLQPIPGSNSIALIGSALVVVVAAVYSLYHQASVSNAATAMNSVLRPEWYFLGFYRLLATIPADLFALIVGVGFSLLVGLPWIWITSTSLKIDRAIAFAIALSIVLTLATMFWL